MSNDSQTGKADQSRNEFGILSDFRYQLRRYMHFSEGLTNKYGITNLQYLLLLHVKAYQNREWATITELAEKLQSHHHGVVALVSRCEKLGLIYRKRSALDKREVEIHLTPEGDRLVTILADQHRNELLDLQNVFKVPGMQEFKHTL